MLELSVLLSKALRQIPPSAELLEKVVLAAWKPAVGEAVWKRTHPFRLFNSTLIVSVPTVLWRKELWHLRKEILDRLNSVLGQRAVTALEFRVDPEFDKDRKPVPSNEVIPGQETVELPLEKIEDAELAQAVAAAATRYFNRP
jgi:hypothetical protein